MNDTPSLELFDVSKRYGTHIALDGVSLEVPQGSILVCWDQTERVRRHSFEWWLG